MKGVVEEDKLGRGLSCQTSKHTPTPNPPLPAPS